MKKKMIHKISNKGTIKQSKQSRKKMVVVKKKSTTKQTREQHSGTITAKFKIFRYDPAKGEPPKYQSYTVTVKESDTILTALDMIKAQQDGTLTYRKNCRNSICGSCCFRINGRAALACKQHVIDELKGRDEIFIQPMGNMPLIKDLVTDMSQFWHHLEAVDPWVDPYARTFEEKEFIISKEERALLTQAGNCIMCGACYSDCNAAEVEKRFLGPAALAKAYRLVADSRDTKTEERIKKYNLSHGTWDCTHCFYCVEVCPMDVAPMDQILKLRKLAMDRKLTTDGMRHHDAFVESIEKSGMLNEITLPMKSVGVFNPIAQARLIPLGVRMMLKDKMPDLLHKPIPNIEEITRLFKNVKTGIKQGTLKDSQQVVKERFGSG